MRYAFTRDIHHPAGQLRPFWSKADAEPLPAVKRLAKRLSIDLDGYRQKSLLFAGWRRASFGGAVRIFTILAAVRVRGAPVVEKGRAARL